MKYRITTTLLDGTIETQITSSDKTAYAYAQGGRSLVEAKTKDGWKLHTPFYPISDDPTDYISPEACRTNNI